MECTHVIAAAYSLIAQLQPEALANLVARRLTRPTQVTQELETQVTLGLVQVQLQELVTQLRGPDGARFNAQLLSPLRGNRHLAVNTNIEDHAGGAHTLSV